MKKVKRKPGRTPLIKFDKYQPVHNTSKIIVVPSTAQIPKVQPLKELIKRLEEVPTYVPTKNEEMTTNECQKQNPFESSKSHRCTFYRPSNQDFGQLTDMALLPDGYDQNLLQERSGLKPDMEKPEQKNACEGPFVQTNSAFAEPARWPKADENEMTNSMDEAQWQTINSISDAHLYLLSRSSSAEKSVPPKGNSEENCSQLVRDNIRISNTPRVKRIADKFVKFERNNIEIRKLEERVVCLEYDIFDLDATDPRAPMQKMRAFFSIKSKDLEGNNEENIPSIPSDVKRNFDIDDGDFQKMSKKEIEIIDDQIPENRSLLEDLQLVLRRKRALEKKKTQPTLDLICLYEMAIRQSAPLNHDYSNTNLLSKAELQEIKDLILKKCVSSVYGINRKTMKCQENTANDTCVLSNSLVRELMREATNV